MRARILLGDCVARMTEMPSESVDSIVSDPPYGLEFMGKAWDKLDGVGEGGAGFSADGMNKGFHALPAYTGSSNPLCRNCKGSRRGRDRVGFKVCRCAEPDFPNVGRIQGDKMLEWHSAWLAEAYRVLVPGGVVKAFGGSRTYHRLAAAMENVGFADMRIEAWGYASGFPKSLNVGKAVAAYELAGCSNSTAVPRDARWSGWGTALKPAWEPVVVGRKPVLSRTTRGTS